MATKVHMEALSPTMEEGQLVRWLKQEGDAVDEGDVLAEIETDKATMELVARGSGVLQGVRIKEGDTAPVGEVIAVIMAEGESPEAETGEASPEPAAKAESGASAEPAEPTEPAAKADGAATPKPPATAKAAQEPAEAETPEKEPHAAEPEARKPSRGAGGADGERLRASPLARRLAEESGVDLATVEGTGPGGRITKRDIEAAVAAGPGRADSSGEAPAPEAESRPDRQAAPPAAPARADAGPESEEIPVSQMRKTIARRLVQSNGPVPTFYLTIEVDMTRMMEVRGRVNERLEKDGVKASINDFVIKAVAAALARHPEVNSAWHDSVIVRHGRVHIGVAVAVEDGLITPIVRDADAKRVRDIAVEVKEMAARAREKKLKPEEYTGATFSVSNLGMFGITEFTAIINPPESGIIAVGAVEDKPVVERGEVVVRPRMRMTMSCDHRVVDGAMGARFLQTLKELIEEPMMMVA
ncbi:MAG TPA: pyruvate dehydrogenase complex dihydrolipoamide acetyltransferase [Longimicrobiales bacterium]|nr:pyruvate dehydrogenase complex dihydrolipoamide acetyltransferase [Longimicrobiales bacterium]